MIFKRFIGLYILGEIVGILIRIVWMHGRKDRRINDFRGHKKNLQPIKVEGSNVLEAGLEPARTNVHWILSPTCLPIPPLEPNCLRNMDGYGAKKGIRTLDLHLGKVMLYP